MMDREKKEIRDEKTVNLIYGLAKEKLKQTSSILDSYNTKATLLFVAIGFIVQILPKQPSLIPIKVSIKEVVLLNGVGAYWIGLILLMVGTFYSFLVFGVVDRNLPPKIKTLKEKYLNKELVDVKIALLSSFNEAIETNSEKIKRKTKNFNNAFSIIFIALVYFLLLKFIV